MNKQKLSTILWWIKKAPLVPFVILVSIILAAILADILPIHSPNEINMPLRLSSPGTENFIMGSDSLGRDILSRVIYGSRISLLVGLTVMVIGGTVGLAVGVIGGYLGGKVDAVLMRVVDIFMSFPPILLALLFTVSLGSGITTVIIAISVTYWARFSRIIRSEVLELREREFVALAKVAGCSSPYIMIRHILPNVLDTFLVVATLNIGMVIRLEATLSFLGAGVPPPNPSWGQMVNEGRDYLNTAWWLSIYPGAALAALVFSFNMIGDWVRDLLDPRLRAVMVAQYERDKWWVAGLSRLWRAATTVFKTSKDRRV